MAMEHLQSEEIVSLNCFFFFVFYPSCQSIANLFTEINYHLSAWLVLRDNSLVMGDMITRVSIGSFNSNIQNFVGTLEQSNACNRVLEAWMPFLFQSNEAVVSQYLDRLLRPIADTFIRGMTLQNLLDFLISPPPQPVCRP